jgi:crotonobetainyl-CoA:carnitine CoA-transferase CaiB-like acyl-CoA transferase
VTQASGSDAPVLEGIRVLDFGRYIAAPLCAAMLADLGADVIRVEPIAGAADREVMPLNGLAEGALYTQMNRNKRSLALDFVTVVGSETLLRLVATADVVVVNMPPKQLAKLGLDYAALSAIRPDIILVTITAYSTSGENRNLTGFDGTGQASSGAMHITGDSAIPTRAAVSYVDYATGINAAHATLAALIRRMRTGKGQQVETSLLQSALAIMNPILIEAATGTRHRSATGNRSPISGPSDAFRTCDGWVMIQIIGNEMFARFVRTIGRDDLIGHPDYASDLARGENGAALSAVVAEWCSGLTAAEVMRRLSEARLPCVPILSPTQAVASDEARSGGYFAQPSGPLLPVVSPMARMAGTVTARPAPKLGEHNAEILREIGAAGG